MKKKSLPAYKCFRGKAVALKLVSVLGKDSFSGNAVKKQRIALDQNGACLTASFNVSNKTVSMKSFLIEQKKAEEILDSFALLFSKPVETSKYPSDGSFDLVLINEEGEDFFFEGSLGNDYSVKGKELSKLVRRYLEKRTLFVLKGKNGRA